MEKNNASRRITGIGGLRAWGIYWGPAILWMTLIFLLSGRQSVSVSSQFILNFLFFKALHVMEYAVLFALIFRAVREFRTAFILTLLYAMTDEIHQSFVPTREGTLRDVIIDGIGASLSWYYLSTLLPKSPKKLVNLAGKWGFFLNRGEGKRRS